MTLARSVTKIFHSIKSSTGWRNYQVGGIPGSKRLIEETQK